MLSHINSLFRAISKPVLLAALTIATLPVATHAQSEVTTEIRANGTTGQVTVSSAETSRVVFTTTLKTNLSQYVSLAANGPNGIKGLVQIRKIMRGGKRGPMYLLQFPKKRKGTTTTLNDGSGKALSVSGAPRTLAGEEATQADIDFLVANTPLSESTIRYLLKFMTKEEILLKYRKPNTTNPGNPGNPTADPKPGELLGAAMVSKDSCDQTATEYELSFIIDLSAIDRATTPATFTVSASVKAGETQASAASLKPTSDGKFAPKPLFLIQGVGYSYGASGEALRLVKWGKDKPGRASSIKIEDRIYYRGQALARAVANGHLNGGKATLEIYNGSKVGVACFNLVRARQRINGYKGGD